MKGGWHQATPFLRWSYQQKTMTKAAKRVFEIISDMNMSEYQFCQKFGFSNSTLNDWKNRNINPSQEKISEICDISGKTLDEFYTQGVYAKENSFAKNRTYRKMDNMVKRLILSHQENEVLPYMEFVLHNKT